MSIRTTRQKKLIEKALPILLEGGETGYSQKTIVGKLKTVGYDVSKSALNKFVNGKGGGEKIVAKAADGFSAIIKSELCMVYNPETEEFEQLEGNHVRKKIPVFGEGKITTPAGELPYIFHQKGRLSIPEKVELINAAKHSIYEVGVRLRGFTNYFTGRSDEEYRVYVEALLDKGVDFNCYLLNPDSNLASLYFNDRAEIFPKEKDSPRLIKGIANQLIDIKNSFEEKNYEGKFKVHTYRNIPCNAFLAVDPHFANGEMIVQHYIYGLERRNSPTLQFKKKNAEKLFEKYLQSLDAIINNAKELTEKYN